MALFIERVSMRLKHGGHNIPVDVIKRRYDRGLTLLPLYQSIVNEYKASFCLKTLEVLEGNLPRKQTRLVQAWAELHIEELQADWELAMSGENPYKIAPLI